MLESDLIGDTIGKLNIIYLVTAEDILIPWYAFTLAYLTLVTVDYGWDAVVLVRARFCEQQLNRMSDLSRKLECFGHAVVELCCCGVSCALWRGALSSFQL